MTKKEYTEEELEEEIDKAFKEDQAKQDHCGTAIPPNREVGIQRTNVKLKEEKE